jgi:hypothetical protein
MRRFESSLGVEAGELGNQSGLGNFLPFQVIVVPVLCFLHWLSPPRSRKGTNCLQKLLTTMASSTRNLIPFASSPLFNRCPQCLHIRPKLSRQLSSTPCRKAMNASPPNPKEALKPMGSRRSRKVEMKRMSASKIPDDLGIIQQTFIRPPNRDMPRLFSKKWKSRLKMEWFWIKTRLMNFGSYV